MSKLDGIRKLRQRHDCINNSVDSTMSDLNHMVDSHHDDPNNWYLEKLVNVLRVQQKILDNRMTSNIGSVSGNTDLLNKELDMMERLVTEVRSKSNLD